MALNYLFGGTPPPSVNTSIASSNGMPDWYQEYIRGIGGRATEIAGVMQNSPVPVQNIAGFNPDQLQSMQQIRSNQGSWRPLTDQAAGVAQQIAPAVQGAVGQANTAVSGQSRNFTNEYQRYMSPYTQGVVDNISRLGTRNFQENIMPGITSSMIGTGQFGSTRNADVLARAGRDVQADISGKQAEALEQGYTTSANIFGADANRAQVQQQMQGSTALGGAGALASGLSTGASTLGGIGQSYSALGLADAQSVGGIGTQQQALQQAELDANFTNYQNLRQDPWTQLNNVNSAVRGIPMPQSPIQTTNAPVSGGTYGAGPIGALGTAYGAAATSARRT